MNEYKTLNLSELFSIIETTKVRTQSQILIDSDKLAECVFNLLNIKDINARTVLRHSIEQQLRAALTRAMK